MCHLMWLCKLCHCNLHQYTYYSSINNHCPTPTRDFSNTAHKHPTPSHFRRGATGSALPKAISARLRPKDSNLATNKLSAPCDVQSGLIQKSQNETFFGVDFCWYQLIFSRWIEEVNIHLCFWHMWQRSHLLTFEARMLLVHYWS